uniref:Uncharacterized protein n=1 Tax=Cucumis melo TaxID=3656 RepID=A0A9I9DTW9_CUCME
MGTLREWQRSNLHGSSGRRHSKTKKFRVDAATDNVEGGGGNGDKDVHKEGFCV